ncbi:hypothetical protein ACKI1I_20675 [Streptomyces turgidiscabies]|uniref:Tat pathway signal sequence domain protein n=1 Tax=Streptomyces turgidiscabies (strain Car8) TaxID=698760 RepID=L7FFT7_STRT8|nr:MULTISPECIES: hypothetical protein [Streptomyces]ELP70177.1 hypothetical protein STRTUCAR8_10110 [Streptomyces turgidiscabies Car8]MDX3496665.1 hypothetical protein [Streptomyces turgidiscabies]
MHLRFLTVSAILALGGPAVALGHAAPAMAASSGVAAPSALTELPAAINPSGGVPAQPQGTTLVQVGFLSQLDYSFVAGQPTAAAQIFNFLPRGVAYGLGADTNDVVVAQLRPLDTTDTLGYITTVALLYIPSNDVDPLQRALLNSGSPLYNNPDSRVTALMSHISPEIPPIPAPQPLD